MIFIILLLLIPLLWLISGIVWRGAEPWSCDEENRALTRGIGTVLLVLAAFIVALPYGPVHKRYDTYSQIVALSDSSVQHGSFFLGSGYVGNDPVYYFYYKTEGGFRRDYVYASDTLIAYGKTPQIAYHHKEYGRLLVPWIETDSEGQTITVPEGSIKQDYTLDNKN